MIETSRPARVSSLPNANTPGGSDSLNGHTASGAHDPRAVEGHTSPQASGPAAPIRCPPAGDNASQGHARLGAHRASALASAPPQATVVSTPNWSTPAGGMTAQPAISTAAPMVAPLAGRQAGQDHVSGDTQPRSVLAADHPSQECLNDHGQHAGVDGQPAAKSHASPRDMPLLADPMLALAADVLDDLEKARISNENRLRQLTRTETDSDGETRGFGLDETHPDVARLAALVGMLAQAEHQAELNLARLMRGHPLGPWVKAQKGIGDKQGARLLAAVGDPYIRPEIELDDGTVEPPRPRTVSELWALCGYHVIPASQSSNSAHGPDAGGEQASHPGHQLPDAQRCIAGVAATRSRGHKANWSPTAKMRAHLVAESCIKQAGTPYRAIYDTTRTKHAHAVHAAECARCGPKNHPAQPGTPLSDGHKHARALRAVAKETLKQLWREARRIHLSAQRGDRTP